MPWMRRTSGWCSRCGCEGPPSPGTATAPPPPPSHPSSPRRYRDLHTFELQAPTRLIEWARGNRECGAGKAPGWALAGRRGCPWPEEIGAPGAGTRVQGEGGKEAVGLGQPEVAKGRPSAGPGPQKWDKCLELFRVQPGPMDCAVTRVCLREGGLGRGAAPSPCSCLFMPTPPRCLCSRVWTVRWERDPAADPTTNAADKGDPGGCCSHSGTRPL